MTGEVHDALVRRLRAAGCVFAEDEARVLVETATGAEHLEELLGRRVAGEPLESIVGWVGFGPLRLSVGPGVFVPRQRTLRLAKVTLAIAREQVDPVLVEVFCGVAPIAARVLHALPGIECHVGDADAAALVHARRNLPGSVGVHLGPGLAALPSGLRGRVTLLAAVPPYVPTAASGLLPREARDHEPAQALYGGADGLDHVRALIDEGGAWLHESGHILLELHRRQLPAASAHAVRAGFDARSHGTDDDQTVVLDLLR